MLWVVALLGVIDVIQDSHHLDRHLAFYSKLENTRKRKKLKLLMLDV